MQTHMCLTTGLSFCLSLFNLSFFLSVFRYVCRRLCLFRGYQAIWVWGPGKGSGGSHETVLGSKLRADIQKIKGLSNNSLRNKRPFKCLQRPLNDLQKASQYI